MLWFVIGAVMAFTAVAADMYVFFGTRTSGPGKGFSVSHFDTDTGKLTPPQFVTEASEPAFFVIHPDGKHVYTCNARQPGPVSAYEIDPKTGGLKLLNSKPTGGDGPSYVSLDKTGHYAIDGVRFRNCVFRGVEMAEVLSHAGTIPFSNVTIEPAKKGRSLDSRAATE